MSMDYDLQEKSLKLRITFLYIRNLAQISTKNGILLLKIPMFVFISYKCVLLIDLFHSSVKEILSLQPCKGRLKFY